MSADTAYNMCGVVVSANINKLNFNKMNKEQRIDFTKGDSKGTIESLINYLEKSKDLGATHYRMEWSNDPMWAFKWFETFKILTDEQLKQSKIDELQKEIDAIKKD